MIEKSGCFTWKFRFLQNGPLGSASHTATAGWSRTAAGAAGRCTCVFQAHFLWFPHMRPRAAFLTAEKFYPRLSSCVIYVAPVLGASSWPCLRPRFLAVRSAALQLTKHQSRGAHPLSAFPQNRSQDTLSALLLAAPSFTLLLFISGRCNSHPLLVPVFL